MLTLIRKKGQNTAEYAILIALVVGGVIAMQTYLQRTFQARLRDAAVTYRDGTNAIGNTLQYEPYYTNSTSQSEKESTATDEGGMAKLEETVNKTTSDQAIYVSNAVVATGQDIEAGAGF